jgi:AraC family transcriptional regulator
MTNANPRTSVFVQVIERPARKVVLKRGYKAKHYFEYCEEVGCDVWEVLGHVEPALHEPMGMWLPESLRATNTSTYVQGVEVPLNFDGNVPNGYDVIELPPCKMMVFQGPPFEEKDFSEAIVSLWDCINQYNPELFGFTWADDDAPRFQLAPMGYRGYIEGRPVRAAAVG